MGIFDVFKGRDKDNGGHKTGEITVRGTDSQIIELPFKAVYVYAEFVDDSEDEALPSCAGEALDDECRAEIASIRGAHRGIVVRWKVKGVRKIRWLAKSSF